MRRLAAILLAILAIGAAAVRAADARRPSFLVIVADDLGFSDLGAFGGEIETPRLDQLAYAGLRMTNFHTAAACSPTRAMLMTGTDHHVAGLGNMKELLTPRQRGKPGYEGHLNDRVVTLAEVLRDAGYRTVMSGKWHLGVEPEHDPYRRGFERTFALLDGGHNHFGKLDLPPKELGGVHYTENGKPVVPTPPFYSSDYFTDRLLEFLREDDSGRPFFAYLAFTAPHWPLQAPPELIAKYRGRYDAGWEALLRERIEGQRRLGLLPPHADLSLPPTLLPWSSLDPAEQARQSRKMEIYAAMVERMDWNVGRVIDHLRESGRLDDTVVIFFSDNGAAPDSVTHTLLKLAGIDVQEVDLDEMGSADSILSYGPHWAQAAAAPRRLYKSASTEGGLLTPAIVHYPGFRRQGAVTDAFATVMDIMPTLLEMAGARHPGRGYRGRPVEPMLGKSMLPFLTGDRAHIHDEEEVFAWELFGQRAVRQGHWKITYVSPPNGSGRWELYDLSRDPGERHDLSAKHPDVLERLIGHWNAYERTMGLILEEQVVSPYTNR